MDPKSKNIPTILIIFGATGDLMRKKLAPALFHLHQKGKLPQKIKIVGFARREFSDQDFQAYLAEMLGAHSGLKGKDLASFLKLHSYQRGYFDEKQSYRELAQTLKRIDDEWGVCTNKLFYLAVAPGMYKTIFNELSFSGLTLPCSPEEGWTRVIVEKPFGEDFTTAQKLDELLGKLFREVQIYRIDHYLAKEMLQNILAFRFSNNLLEKNWSAESIERVDIRVWEKIGVEERGPFYDPIGALRDVGQNHLLQMLALVTMDLPADFTSQGVRRSRADVLKKLKILTPAEIKADTFRAQYSGYRAIAGIRPGSRTETYFKIKAYLESPRWRWVPVFMESGKRLGEVLKEVVVTFKHPAQCLCLGSERHQNKVVFSLEPEERITIHFWSKKPGLELEFEERKFDFLLRDAAQKSQYVEEYEKLLLDCITGEQTLFVATEEVRAMWKFIDPIVRGWAKNSIPLKFYKPNTSVITKETVPEGKKEKHFPRKKEIAIIGLGKMGLNLASRLRGFGWQVTAFDKDEKKRAEAAARGISAVADQRELADTLKTPRIVWLMVPAGKPVEEVIFGREGLTKFLKKGDIIIDGGNSFYEDSIKRAKKLVPRGIHFLDAGVSGGPEGALLGASIMVGGEKKIFTQIEHLFQDLAVAGGYGLVGKNGAGHFVKMAHNGIEYGMMQAIAEGFSVMKKSRFGLNLEKVAEIYNHGSVIESRLVGWLKEALAEFGEELDGVSGRVAHTGEGEWTVRAARELKVPVRIIDGAFQFRVQSRENPSFTGKILTALRNKFGGHKINE